MATPLPSPFNATDLQTCNQFEKMGVTETWKKYRETLSFGRGQTLVLLDDSCDIDISEWKAQMPWGPKLVAARNTVEDNDDPRPIPPAYHGTAMGFPSSLNFDGKGGIAFNNNFAAVRCVREVHIVRKDLLAATHTIRKALGWVLENRKRLNITAVNLAPLDDQAHPGNVISDLDPILAEMRENGIWVGAPCGNNGHVTGVSWPAASPYCFAIGSAHLVGSLDEERYVAQFDRFSNTDILALGGPTSTCNAYLAGSSMILREAIERTGYEWTSKASNLPEAMLAIFQETGEKATDEQGTGLDFMVINLLRAVDHVFSGAKGGTSAHAESEAPSEGISIEVLESP